MVSTTLKEKEHGRTIIRHHLLFTHSDDSERSDRIERPDKRWDEEYDHDEEYIREIEHE